MQEPSELSSMAIDAIKQQASELVAGKSADWATLAGLLPAALTVLLPGYEGDATDASPAQPPAL